VPKDDTPALTFPACGQWHCPFSFDRGQKFDYHHCEAGLAAEAVVWPRTQGHVTMITYFARLSTSRLILWCYLTWFVAVVCLYFDDSPALWISSLGLSFFIGIALILAARQPNQKIGFWMAFRLFLIPFCVSSYSSLIKGKGFILLFPPDPRSLSVCLLSCLGVVVLHFICRLIASPERPLDRLPGH